VIPLRLAAKAKARRPVDTSAIGLLYFQIRANALPPPAPEYRFAAMSVGGTGAGVKARLAAAFLHDWRFDMAWPAFMLAVEMDGGGFVGGRHGRGLGIEKDCEKYSAAAVLGWRLVRCTPRQVKSGQAVEWIANALAFPA